MGERIELPGGYYGRPAANTLGTMWVICESSGRVFVDNVEIDELRRFAAQIAPTQGDAAGWQPIEEVPIGTAVFFYRKGYDNCPFSGVIDTYMPGKKCVLEKVSGRFVSPEKVYILPAAPQQGAEHGEGV